MSPEENCAVCGRTILAGERTRDYVSPAGPRVVCELCAVRAERLGWQRQGEAGAEAPALPPRRRGRLRALWRRRRGEPQPTEAPPPAEAPDEEPVAEEPPRPSPDPAAPGARPQRLTPEPSPVTPFERAIERFNASEASRTVAGLVRTLGPPWVSVGAAGGSPKEVRITVAWELSWYQWGVDLGDELRPVFQLDKGPELSQLDSAARQWNASAGEGGQIVLAGPSRQGAAGEPVGR